MADEKYKIKIEVDDSAEKQYEAEFKSRLKVKTATAIEEEKRKTAQLKGEVEKSVQSQLEAERQGNKMKIKEAIAYRKIMESQLRLYEQEVRLSNAKDLSEFRSLLKEKERLQKQADRDIKNAPRTMLRGETGSLSRLGQVNNALSGMTFGTDQYKATEQLSKNLTANLNKVGVDTRNLAQKIGGELKGALAETTAGLQSYAVGLIGVMGAQKLFNISLESARFDTLKANFKGTEQDMELFRKAVSGTVDDASLMKLSNQATDLGIGLKEQALLFSLAEDSADKYGTSVEEGFQKVVFATEGNTKGLKMLGIEKAKYEEIVKSLVEKTKGETEEITNENGEREISIKNLSAEEQKRIRLQAVLIATGSSYDDLNKKVGDSADMHEHMLVVVKNLTNEWGGEFVSAITGVGTAWAALDYIVKKWGETLKTAGNVVDWATTGLKNLGNEIPGLSVYFNNASSSVGEFKNMLLDALGLMDEINNKAVFGQQDAKGGTRFGGKTKENEAGNSNFSTNNSGSRNSGSTTQEQKQLTFLEELRKKIVDVQAEIDSLNKDLGSTNLKEYERLRIEEKLIEKRQELNDLIRETIAIANGERSAVGGDKPIAKGARGKQNPRAGNDPRGDMSSEEIDKLLNGVQLSFEDIKGIADSIVQPFQNILQFAGLTETSFGRILAMIQTVLNAGSDVFSFFTSILSFIPGGGAISAIGGLAGGASQGLKPMGGGHSGGMSFNPTVIVNSEVEKTKSVKFYQNTLPEFNRRQAVKSL